MKIITDTREQLSLDFSKIKGVEVVRTKLDAGDYSIVGYENQISFERKSVQDLVGTLIGGHERFLREMERWADYKEKYILVEHTPSILFAYCVKHGWTNKFDTIIQSLLAYACHYNVRVRFCKNREDMAKYIVRKGTEFINAYGEVQELRADNSASSDRDSGQAV